MYWSDLSTCIFISENTHKSRFSIIQHKVSSVNVKSQYNLIEKDKEAFYKYVEFRMNFMMKFKKISQAYVV